MLQSLSIGGISGEFVLPKDNKPRRYAMSMNVLIDLKDPALLHNDPLTALLVGERDS